MRGLHRAFEWAARAVVRHAALLHRECGRDDAGRHRYRRKAASLAGSLGGRGGVAVRILHQRLDHDGCCAAARQSQTNRCADPRRPGQHKMPMRHPCCGDPGGQARKHDHGGSSTMTNMTMAEGMNRRAFLVASGALVVSVAGSGLPDASAFAQVSATRPAFTPDQLDSWLSLDKTGGVTAFFGKIDVAQGIDVAVSQIIADELDIPLKSVKIVMGNSDLTIDHGGTTSDSGICDGGAVMRLTAAEARRLLLEMASQQLGAEVSALQVSDGIVSVASNPGKKISYAELVGGRYFNASLDWNKKTSSSLRVKGKATPK